MKPNEITSRKHITLCQNTRCCHSLSAYLHDDNAPTMPKLICNRELKLQTLSKLSPNKQEYLRLMSPKEEYSKLFGWNLLIFCWKINLSEDNNQLE